MANVVIRAHSEAQVRRILECAQLFDVHVYLVDDVPKHLLPRNMDYLGYIFVNDSKEDRILAFAKYAQDIDKIANEWTPPTTDAGELNAS